jgi:hypothetical protein
MALGVVVDPVAIATDLANNTGGAVLTAITGVLPVLVPVLIGFWAVGFVWAKIGPRRHGL